MSAKHVLVCWECGRPGRITEDNQTYCEHCGPGVEAVPDETLEEIIKKCEQQLSIVGDNASVGLLIPGRWGKASTRRLWGGPVGKIVMEFEEGLVYVVFSAAELKEAVQKILDESTAYDNDCRKCEM